MVGRRMNSIKLRYDVSKMLEVEYKVGGDSVLRKE